LVLLLGAAFAVEWYWLTGGEREAGKAALTKIEALEQLEKNANDGFDAMDSQAKASVALARQKAWTLRDRRTLEELEFYRWELETVHDRRIRELELRSIVIQRHLEWHENPELEQKSREADDRTLNWIRSLLHRELD
jgi:hypothetical protein